MNLKITHNNKNNKPQHLCFDNRRDTYIKLAKCNPPLQKGTRRGLSISHGHILVSTRKKNDKTAHLPRGRGGVRTSHRLLKKLHDLTLFLILKYGMRKALDRNVL